MSSGGTLTESAPSALGVPFPSQLEAEIACASFAPYRDPYGCLVGQQLTVFGSVLAMLVLEGPGSGWLQVAGRLHGGDALLEL